MNTIGIACNQANSPPKRQCFPLSTVSHLPFDVSELGEHERPIESQLCHIVVVQPRRQQLENTGREEAGCIQLNIDNRLSSADGEGTHVM